MATAVCHLVLLVDSVFVLFVFLNQPRQPKRTSQTQNKWEDLHFRVRTGGSVHAYIHLPSRHKVCTLPDPLKYLLQLGVDEGVV